MKYRTTNNIQVESAFNVIDDNGCISPAEDNNYKNELLYIISRFEVERLYTDRIMNDFRPDEESLIVKHSMGKVTFMIDGYNDDKREVWDIPEVRRFITKIHNDYPCWLYFSAFESNWLKVVFSCISENKSMPCLISITEVQSFFMPQFDCLEKLCKLANKSKNEMNKRMQDGIASILK